MPTNLQDFSAALQRVSRYLASSKLKFNDEDTLELNPSPFIHAADVAGRCTPLAFAVLTLKETCWASEELVGRQILVEALQQWCQRQAEALSA